MKLDGEKLLAQEIAFFKSYHPRLAEDALFVLWYLRARVSDDDERCIKALVGGSNDKGVDAVLVDDRAKMVFIVQGKYHKRFNNFTENRADVMSFTGLADALVGDSRTFAALVENARDDVRDALDTARAHLKRKGHALQLHYASTGRCSDGLQREAAAGVRKCSVPTEVHIVGGHRIGQMVHDYIDGVAPPIPEINLLIETGRGGSEGMLKRFDGKTDIDSWVFTMSGDAIGALFRKYDIRLFARNVRGFLGDTDINEGMQKTITGEPARFWYYNNGITVVCDNADPQREHGRDYLRVTNPQIINGQQTTRMLAKAGNRAASASVLVRVIAVPRRPNQDDDHFESLISNIVAATNWQNAIKPSDLMTNDRRQIEIEREFRKLGYFYVRKRQTKGEARRAAANPAMVMVKKDELAQAVAACELDPGIVREGKEGLFEKQMYRKVFASADPNFYLSRYWLARQVSYAARGYPERSYAKWVTLHFVWGHLSSHLTSRSAHEAFRRLCEANNSDLNPLIGAINACFVGALRLYGVRRGKGATALDTSSFFKRKGLHDALESFWRSPRNRSAARFRRQWKRFVRTLASA